MKKILTVVLFLGLLSSSMLLTSCKDSLLDPTTQTNPNLFTYQISIKEYILPPDSNAVDVLNGLIAGDLAASRDIEMPDSITSERFYLRSGDGTNPRPINGGSHVNSAIGYETMFTTGWSITSNQFDTLSTFLYNSNSLSPSDFSRHTTYGFEDNFNNTPYRAYGFYLKGKYGAGISTSPVYGMLYLQSTERLNDGSFRLTIKIKLNRAGLNQFGETIPL